MNIVYELNPPKIVKGHSFDLAELEQDMQLMGEKASELAGLASGIHFTDSVLGIPRVSGVTAAAYVKKNIGDSTRLSCSVRVRDRNFTSVCQLVSDAIFVGVDGLLVLMGDEPADNPGNSGLKPSGVVKMLQHEGYNKKIKLYLSFPAKVKDRSSQSIQNKIDAQPHAIVTQSIASLSDLGEIVDIVRPHKIKVVVCIMVPSEKNRQSASIIGLDWKEYENNAADFVRQAGKMVDEVLLTSPNSFASGVELLKQLR